MELLERFETESANCPAWFFFPALERLAIQASSFCSLL